MRPVKHNSALFEGFENGRLDGRSLEEFRPFCFKTKVLKGSPGSAYVSFGNDEDHKTEIIASINGPRPAQRTAVNKAELNITIEYSPFTRKEYNENSPEIKRMEADIYQCFEGVILLDQYPKSRIDINILIVQDNGEALCAAINAASMALVCGGIAVRDVVSATSAYSIAHVETLEAERRKKTGSAPEAAVQPAMTVVDMSAVEADFYSTQRPRAVSSVVLGLCSRLGGVAFVRSTGNNLSETTHELLLAVVEQGCGELAEVMREAIAEDLIGSEDEQM